MQSNGTMNGNSIVFTYKDLRFEGHDITKPWQIIIDIVALFTITIDSRILYQQDSFPLLEFARELQNWLDSDFYEHRDFIYDSVEWEEAGLVQILSKDEKMWGLASYFEQYQETKLFDDVVIKIASESFLTYVIQGIEEAFGIKELPDYPKSY